MGKKGRFLAGALLILAAAWLAGRMLLDHQLARPGLRPVFPDPLEPGVPLESVFSRLPAEGGGKTELQLLDSNIQAWTERWRLLAGAREQLDVSYFILQQDIFGLSFLGHLMQKAQEGVRVRVLLDALGTKMSRDFRGNDYIDTLVHTEGVTVRIFRPLASRYLDAFLALNPAAAVVSAHDKIMVADRERSIIGGRNIGHEYFASPKASPAVFRDTDLALFGEEAGRALEEIFETEYGSAEASPVMKEAFNLVDTRDDLILAYRAMAAWLAGEPLADNLVAAIRERDLPWLTQLEGMPQLRGALALQRPPVLTADIRLLDSRRRLVAADDVITRTLVRLVASARDEIFIQTPYVVLSRHAAEVLSAAGRRGVRITILTNSPWSSDNALSQAFFLEQWPELLARVPGLRIFVAGDQRNLHGKLAVFDRRLVLVGTYNLDPVSMTLNSEMAAAALSSEFSELLLKSREERIESGPPAIFEYRIARDPEGKSQRGEDGEILIEFGPGDHLQPEQMAAAQRLRKIVRWSRALNRNSPFF